MNDEIKKAEEIGSIMEKSRLTGRRTGISSSDELIDKSEELTDIEELSVDDEVENSQKHDNWDDELNPPNIMRGFIRQ